VTASCAVVPARPLAAQVHALHAAAALLERAGISGLSLSVHDDRVTIQVPAGMATLEIRIAAVARLAAAAGSRPCPGAGWVSADGDLAGHQLHIFTPAGQAP
jgi:hypothetical protein